VVFIHAHAGPMTGEDGPTHADPQALQILQGSFPPDSHITLVPWHPAEVWPLLVYAMQKRPAVVSLFVPRPAVTAISLEYTGLSNPVETCAGVYRLCDGDESVPPILLQGPGAATVFMNETRPWLQSQPWQPEVWYVSSCELSNQLPDEPRNRLAHALGFTDFTAPTMFEWITQPEARQWLTHPFSGGHYTGSGPWQDVLKESKLDFASQINQISSFYTAFSTN
jgi:transketolase